MNDYILRATAANDQIRAFAITSKDMVSYAQDIHGASPIVTAALGRMLSAASMMGVMLKNDNDLMTLQLYGDGPLKGITVTSDSKGNVKGYPFVNDVVLPHKNGKLDVGGSIFPGYLRVIKDMGLKEPYVGTTELQTGEIAEDLTYYFAVSEQVPSSVGLGVLINKDASVNCAGGFIIQLLPSCPDEVIEKLEENLKVLPSVTDMLSSGLDPLGMLEKVLNGFDIDVMDKIPVEFKCDCSVERVERSLISLSKEDLEDIVNDGKPVEIRCQFCNKKYEFSIDEIKKIKEKAGK